MHIEFTSAFVALQSYQELWNTYRGSRGIPCHVPKFKRKCTERAGSAISVLAEDDSIQGRKKQGRSFQT